MSDERVIIDLHEYNNLVEFKQNIESGKVYKKIEFFHGGYENVIFIHPDDFSEEIKEDIIKLKEQINYLHAKQNSYEDKIEQLNKISILKLIQLKLSNKNDWASCLLKK